MYNVLYATTQWASWNKFEPFWTYRWSSWDISAFLLYFQYLSTWLSFTNFVTLRKVKPSWYSFIPIVESLSLRRYYLKPIKCNILWSWPDPFGYFNQVRLTLNLAQISHIRLPELFWEIFRLSENPNGNSVGQTFAKNWRPKVIGSKMSMVQKISSRKIFWTKISDKMILIFLFWKQNFPVVLYLPLLKLVKSLHNQSIIVRETNLYISWTKAQSSSQS